MLCQFGKVHMVLFGIVRYCLLRNGIVRYCLVDSGMVRYRYCLIQEGHWYGLVVFSSHSLVVFSSHSLSRFLTH